MPEIFDIEQAVNEWAKHDFKEDATEEEKTLLKKEKDREWKHIVIKIDWRNVTFDDKTEWPGDMGGNATSKPAEIGEPVTKVVFETQFENKTENKQHYTIKVDKMHKSTFTTTLDKTYTRGKKTQVKLCLKGAFDIFDMCKGVQGTAEWNRMKEKTWTLSNKSGETFEDQLAWGVDSQIEVKPYNRSEAKVELVENRYDGHFVVKTKATGRVRIKYLYTIDNDCRRQFTSENIAKIVKWYKEKKKTDWYSFVDVTNDKVEIETNGQCQFRLAINQQINVTNVSLVDDKQTDTNDLNHCAD